VHAAAAGDGPGIPLLPLVPDLGRPLPADSDGDGARNGGRRLSDPPPGGQDRPEPAAGSHPAPVPGLPDAAAADLDPAAPAVPLPAGSRRAHAAARPRPGERPLGVRPAAARAPVPVRPDRDGPPGVLRRGGGGAPRLAADPPPGLGGAAADAVGGVRPGRRLPAVPVPLWSAGDLRAARRGVADRAGGPAARPGAADLRL